MKHLLDLRLRELRDQRKRKRCDSDWIVVPTLPAVGFGLNYVLELSSGLVYVTLWDQFHEVTDGQEGQVLQKQLLEFVVAVFCNKVRQFFDHYKYRLERDRLEDVGKELGV